MSVDLNSLILAGVLTHLLAGLGKALFKAPKQQAQIDSIEGKVDAVINQVATLAPGPTPNPLPRGEGAGPMTNAQGGQ